MGQVLVEPTLEVEDIEVEFDEGYETPDNKKYNYGYRVPLVKVNDYLLKFGEIVSFTMSIGINSLPTFSITINDQQYKIREALKKDIDFCIIFVGYNDWYIKFKGLMNTASNNPESHIIYADGSLFVPKFYDIEQYIYTDMTIQDIIVDVCTKVGIGLYVVDCPDLSKTISKVINPGMQFINFLSFVIRKYTNCIYSIDGFGYMYISTIDSFKNEEIGKYKYRKANVGELDETDIIISSKYLYTDKEYEKDDDKDFNVEDFTHSSNYSDKHINSYLTYNLIDTKEEVSIETSDELGTGDIYYNVFEGFSQHVNPYHNSITNKSLSGNVTKLTLLEPTFELTPFMMIQFNCYLLRYSRGEGEKDEIHLDEEHSGKRMVLKFSYKYNFDNYTKDNANRMRILQYIDLL